MSVFIIVCVWWCSICSRFKLSLRDTFFRLNKRYSFIKSVIVFDPYTGYTINAYCDLRTGRNWRLILLGNDFKILTLKRENAASVDLSFLLDAKQSINIDVIKWTESGLRLAGFYGKKLIELGNILF